MTFTIMPALDVSRGRLAVAGAGGPRPIDAFGGDPVAATRAMIGSGATALHVVDLDLAFEGRSGLDVVAIRAAAPAALLQVSGGIGDIAVARPYLAAGADRFVLGSSALTDEAVVRAMLGEAGPAVIVGIEIDGGRIRGRSAGGGAGAEGEGLDLVSTLGWLSAAGAPAYLVTSTRRVGALDGPDVDPVRRVSRAGRPTFAAGGIRSLDDLRALRDAGAAGAVVGRAVLEGRLDLTDALAWTGA